MTHVLQIQKIDGANNAVGEIRLTLDDVAYSHLFDVFERDADRGASTQPEIVARMMEYVCLPTHRVIHSRCFVNEGEGQ